MSERTLDGLAAARARGRTGGQKPKLTPRQAKIARQMYEETGPDGRRLHTVEQIASEFGVTRPITYRHLATLTDQLAACLDFLTPGDTLVVPALDRLGRSLQDLISTVGDLRSRGVGFTSLRENLDTTTPADGSCSTCSRRWLGSSGN